MIPGGRVRVAWDAQASGLKREASAGAAAVPGLGRARERLRRPRFVSLCGDKVLWMVTSDVPVDRRVLDLGRRCPTSGVRVQIGYGGAGSFAALYEGSWKDGERGRSSIGAGPDASSEASRGEGDSSPRRCRFRMV